MVLDSVSKGDGAKADDYNVHQLAAKDFLRNSLGVPSGGPVHPGMLVNFYSTKTISEHGAIMLGGAMIAPEENGLRSEQEFLYSLVLQEATASGGNSEFNLNGIVLRGTNSDSGGAVGIACIGGLCQAKVDSTSDTLVAGCFLKAGDDPDAGGGALVRYEASNTDILIDDANNDIIGRCQWVSPDGEWCLIWVDNNMEGYMAVLDGILTKAGTIGATIQNTGVSIPVYDAMLKTGEEVASGSVVRLSKHKEKIYVIAAACPD